MSFSVLGTGSAIPSLCKTNDDLAEILDTSDEWIRSKTGIEKRYLLGSETITSLAVLSAKRALLDSGTQISELDLIICATVTPDFITPSMACLVQQELGASCPAFDINGACSGFIYAWDVALGYFERKPDSRILVIGAEAISKIVDWRDRSTAVIFADGAGATVLGRSNSKGILSIKLSAKGNEEVLGIRARKGNCPFRESGSASTSCEQEFVHMKGQEVFKFAVSSMCRDLKHVIKSAGLLQEDITYVLPHQANLRIIDYAKSRLDIPEDRYLTNISRRGNTSAAAIPILLDEYNKKGYFKKGDLLAFTVFGAGLTSAACVLEW